MKTLLLSLAYTIGIGELILAGYFWVTNSKNEIRRVMALLAFSTGMWVITSALSSYTSQSPTTIFILKSIYVFGVFLVTSLVHLSIIFPISIVRFDKLHAFLLYIPALIWSCIAMTSNSIVLNYVGTTDSPGLVVSGTLHHTYNYYLLFLFFAALQNQQNEPVMQPVTELKITDTQVGQGAEAKDGDTVFVHYTGTLTNGQVFDSSIPRGEPFSFQLGQGMVIQGWEIGIKGMKVGGKRHLVIPASLAYGDRAIGSIPANSTLVFDVELLKIEGAK
jgi:hypothetical protein